MSRYQVVLTTSAQRELLRLRDKVRDRFILSMRRMADQPLRKRPGVDVKPLSGHANVYRLRVGNHRGLFTIEGRTIIFTHFRHRSKGYRF